MTAGIRYRVLHETRYVYSSTVAMAHQLAHLCPRETAWQRVIAHRLDVDPAPAESNTGRDFFGNDIVRLMVDSPHDELVVQARSTVDVASHAPAPEAASAPWEAALATPGVWADVNLEVEAFRLASPAVPLLKEAQAYAARSFAPARPWLEAAFDLTRRIQAEFAYDPTATTVTTRVAEVLKVRRGVCQDFAHLMLSCLRSLGLPARYVSGYVLNRPRPGRPRLAGADASHAWVAAWHPDFDWVAFDPTNGKIADTEFVTLGWGREFADVTPLRGVVLGAASQTLEVAVTVEPVTEEPSAPAPPTT